jgi:hypothetical protein
MLIKLLPGLVFLVLAGCSEPVISPPVATKQPDESGVYPPILSPSDSTVLTLWVAAEKRECMAVGPTECLQIRFHPDENWQLFYGEIQGFDYQPGQLYQLEVSELMVPQPAADAPDRQWVLRQIISADSD